MKTQRFGIEIEMTGVTRQYAAKLAATFFGTNNYEFTHYTDGYQTWSAWDAQGRKWKFARDVSIYPYRKTGSQIVGAEDEYRTEMVSPILTYEDIPMLQELIRQLRHAGALSGPKYGCGIHIHVDAAPFTPNTLRNIVNIISAKEDLIYKSLDIAPSRVNQYCKKTNKRMVEAINAKKPKTMAEFEQIWYDGHIDHSHYNYTRYHGLNLHATFTKGTVEFRLFNGTTHAGKIRSYIVFCLAVTHQALTQKRASAKKFQTDNEKYTFRCWLLKLGLSGDEFKNCREHLMKNLEGCSAWRHGAPERTTEAA